MHVKKIVFKSLFVLSLASAGLCGCEQPHTAPHPDHVSELRAAGYTGAPIITAVSQPSPGTVVVTGQALPDGRVRFLYGQDRAVGVTADGQGHFSAELPISGAGALYDLSMEDSGALLHAEGRLFVPAGQAAKAVLLRPGSPAAPIATPTMGIAIVDYDSAGALGVVGRVAPRAGVNLMIGSEVRAQPIGDAVGLYSAVTQISPPTANAATITVAVEAAGAEWKRTVPVSKPAEDKDAVTAVDGGWRVDWQMPGGGVQTTLVF